MNGIPAFAPTTFASDMTTLLAIESLFGSRGTTIDPTCIATAATFFDAVVNSSKLSFVLAVSEEELAASETISKKRTNDLFQWLTSAEAHEFSPPDVALATTLNANYSNDRAHIERLASQYIGLLNADPDIRENTIKWAISSRDVGGDRLRPNYSYPVEFLRPFEALIKQEVPDITFETFAYCLDFISKFLPYFDRAEGPYVGHTIRSLTGMWMSPARFRVSSLPLAISFRDPVSRRLEARKYLSAREFLEQALRTRKIVQSSNIMSARFSDRPGIAEKIVEDCSTFFPYLTRIDRNPALVSDALHEARKVGGTALGVWIVEQLLARFATGHFHFDSILAMLSSCALSISLHSAHSLTGIVVPLGEHILVKLAAKNGIYAFAPTGLSAEVVTNSGQGKMCSLNVDTLFISHAANLDVLAEA